MKLLSQHEAGDVAVRYLHDESSGRVGLQLIPLARLDREVERRATLRGLPNISRGSLSQLIRSRGKPSGR